MPKSIGTRSNQTVKNERMDQGQQSRFYSRDVGMSKNVAAAITFGGGNLTAANGTFATFAVQDQVLVGGTNLNNGYSTVTAIDAANHAFLTVDPPPKAEGPIAATVRTL
jgi:hypothetical protein